MRTLSAQILSIIFLISSSTWGQTASIDISDLQLENQFDEKVHIPPSVQFVLFSTDMDGFNLIKEALDKKQMNKDFFTKGGLLISDISKMPSLIYKFAAKPKMQEYPFKLALDKEGQQTEKWPREKKKVFLFKVQNLKVTETIPFSTSEEIQAFLGTMK